MSEEESSSFDKAENSEEYQESLKALDQVYHHLDRKAQKFLSTVKRMVDNLNKMKKAYNDGSPLACRKELWDFQNSLEEVLAARNRLEFQSDKFEECLQTAAQRRRKALRRHKRRRVKGRNTSPQADAVGSNSDVAAVVPDVIPSLNVDDEGHPERYERRNNAESIAENNQTTEVLGGFATASSQNHVHQAVRVSARRRRPNPRVFGELPPRCFNAMETPPSTGETGNRPKSHKKTGLSSLPTLIEHQDLLKRSHGSSVLGKLVGRRRSRDKALEFYTTVIVNGENYDPDQNDSND